MIFDKVEESIKYDIDTLENKQEFLKENRSAIVTIAKAMLKLERNITTFYVDEFSLNISVHGDKHVLTAAFSGLRKLGYNPGTRPEANQVSYYARFDIESGACPVYLNFSSTSCRRVKIGTEMKSMDVYETVCE